MIAKELSRFLEEQIIFGELAPSARLIEEEIVRRHGVSRSPVREALRMLEQDGLAVRESRRGVRVSPIDLKDLDEVYTCRLVLEGLAAEGAADNRTDGDIGLLRASLNSLQAAYDQRDLREYFRQNVVLTDQIHVVSGNATLGRLLGNIGKQALRYRYIAYSRSPEMMKVSVEGNHEIVDAIARRRARNARTLMEDLIQRSWEVVRTHVAALEAAGAMTGSLS
ncbi:MAG: GntR family transcriptional regulator [Pseudomonadota bacterium]